ncbi:hypothetical protein I3760_10G087800 [Carya illinoinensis]|nr:hypothetical protein I3760_10G087800 [Carya illinoinensis]
MREEVISSGGTIHPASAASSAGASSPAVPTNVGSIDGSCHGHGSKAASLSCIGSQPPRTSLSTSAGGSAFGSSRPSCRPWERGDLLRRLATFKPSNWLQKPKVISSLSCAQRGWINVDVDKIECESCGAYLSFALIPSWTPSEVQNAAEAFAKQLDAVHNVSCPWRGNSCPDSLVQFPPTPQSALIGGYKDRCDGLVQFQYLPIVAASAIEKMQVSHGPQVERFLFGEVDTKPESIPEIESSQDGAFCLYSRAQKLISLCGWEPIWVLNVQDCEEHSAQSARNGCSVGPNQAKGHLSIQSARDSTRASSVIAMDTGFHSVNDDSMDSVENYPADVDDVHFPSSSIYGNLDVNDTSELDYSNQAQQSIGFRSAVAVPGEMGVSSTNDGEELFNAETVTVQARDGFSFGISGGSVGMCASHEAEIHGADASVHRADSIVGDVEPRAEDAENQGQTGESATDPGLMDEIVPDEINREDPQGDSQEILPRSIGRADSSSKVYGPAKTESVESGEKISQSDKLVLENNAHPSLSCNANKTTKKEVTNAGPPKGKSNYEEAMEFDPIVHHNQFCPWVNGNVATAGCNSCGSSTGSDAIALCGWQLTLDALDALQSFGNIAIQMVQSESAASLYKDDHRNRDKKKLLQHHSISRSHGRH